jgi:broad specificity phosphatase PhoE
MTWFDAELTTLGESQALKANAFWKESLTTTKIPAPESYYSSPLERCLSTANLTYSGLALPETRPFRPVIKELLREDLGVHTCDKRHKKSEIAKKWPNFAFEEGFPEEDPFWDPDWRESHTHHVYRSKLLLDDIFEHDDATIIALSSHSGAISTILEAVGHRKFQLQTGGMIPVLLRIRRNEGQRPSEKLEPPSKPKVCNPPAKF